MKRFFLAVALSACVAFGTFSAFAQGEGGELAEVIMWTGWTSTGINVQHTFADGSSAWIYGGKFVEKEVSIVDAVQNFRTYYTACKASMDAAKLTSSQVNFNLGKWTDEMTAEVYSGLGEQQELDNARIKAASDAAEDAQRSAFDLSNETTSRMIDLHGSINQQLAQISEMNSLAIQAMVRGVETKEKELRQLFEETLSNVRKGIEITNREIAERQALAADIAQLKASINKLEEAEGKNPSVDIGKVQMPLFTNELKRITHWLGNTNANERGMFVRPVNPMVGEPYSEAHTIVDWLDDIGLVQYYGRKHLDMEVPPRMFCYSFGEEEVEDGGVKVTNVYATFKAPRTWADGETVICSNGEYSIHRKYQFVTNIVWATNWTEAVKHITKSETTNIVNVVTNIVNHESFVTNVFNHANFVTNTFNHINFTTNVWNHENFVTNVFNRETFVTNFIENMSSIEKWNYVTNVIVRYLGGTYDGEDPDIPPVKPEDDPYSPEYEPEPDDSWLLPVKNARILVGLTNNVVKASNMRNALDMRSVDTNNVAEKIQIAGFGDLKPSNTNYHPVTVIKTDAKGNEFLGVEWVEVPPKGTTNMLTEAEYNLIRKVMNYHTNGVDAADLIVATTNVLVKFDNMRTNFFGHVVAGTMLDDKSVWTNGEGKVEVKGFQEAKVGQVPVVEFDESLKANVVRWGDYRPFAVDSESTWGVIGSENVQHRSIDLSEDFMLPTNNVLTLHGFNDAEVGSVPYKRKIGLDNNTVELAWKQPGMATKLVGTDGSETVIGSGSTTNEVQFLSIDEGGSVEVEVGKDMYGEKTVISIGAFYK